MDSFNPGDIFSLAKRRTLSGHRFVSLTPRKASGEKRNFSRKSSCRHLLLLVVICPSALFLGLASSRRPFCANVQIMARTYSNVTRQRCYLLSSTPSGQNAAVGQQTGYFHVNAARPVFYLCRVTTFLTRVPAARPSRDRSVRLEGRPISHRTLNGGSRSFGQFCFTIPLPASRSDRVPLVRPEWEL